MDNPFIIYRTDPFPGLPPLFHGVIPKYAIELVKAVYRRNDTTGKMYPIHLGISSLDRVDKSDHFDLIIKREKPVPHNTLRTFELILLVTNKRNIIPTIAGAKNITAISITYIIGYIVSSLTKANCILAYSTPRIEPVIDDPVRSSQRLLNTSFPIFEHLRPMSPEWTVPPPH